MYHKEWPFGFISPLKACNFFQSSCEFNNWIKNIKIVWQFSKTEWCKEYVVRILRMVTSQSWIDEDSSGLQKKYLWPKEGRYRVPEFSHSVRSKRKAKQTSLVYEPRSRWHSEKSHLNVAKSIEIRYLCSPSKIRKHKSIRAR